MKLVIISILLALQSYAHAYNYTQAEYGAIRDISLRIAHLYPSDKYIYVGVGRSPTPIMAFLETLFGAKQTLHLPLGGMKGFSAEYPEVYTSENRERLKGHLAHFLNPLIQQGKTPLFIDVALEGKSFVNTVVEIQSYFGETIGPQFLALTYPHLVLTLPGQVFGLIGSWGEKLYRIPVPFSKSFAQRLLEQNKISTMEVPRALFKKYLDEAYDEWAVYDSFQIVDHRLTMQGLVFKTHPEFATSGENPPQPKSYEEALNKAKADMLVYAFGYYGPSYRYYAKSQVLEGVRRLAFPVHYDILRRSTKARLVRDRSAMVYIQKHYPHSPLLAEYKEWSAGEFASAHSSIFVETSGHDSSSAGTSYSTSVHATLPNKDNSLNTCRYLLSRGRWQK